MRIAVVSDIHGNLRALQAVAADIERRKVDEVVNLGDILSGPLMVTETADFLTARMAASNGRADWAYALTTGRMPARPATIPG